MSSSMSGYGGMSAATGSGGRGNFTGEKIPRGYAKGSLQQYDPQQMELYGQQFQHLGPQSYLGRLAGGDQSLFDEMEAPAYRQFNEQIGGLASRFSGMGTGARRSSGFQNTGTAAASNFAQDLASKRGQLRQQAIRELMGMSNTLLGQRPQEQFLVEKEKGGWGGLVGAGLGAAGGFAAGGPAGALTGASLGYKVGSAF